jgi:hypothetical protein
MEHWNFGEKEKQKIENPGEIGLVLQPSSSGHVGRSNWRALAFFISVHIDR